MTKSAVPCVKKTKPCKCNTINLAKEGLTANERKTKILLYENKNYPKSKSCGMQLPVGVTVSKCTKTIRMCTAADIKSTCPPPMCSCPPVPPPRTLGSLILKATAFGIKSAIAGAVIYSTWKIGIWGSAQDTECLYVVMKNRILGTEHRVTDGSPRVDRNLHTAKECWNNLVSRSFGFVACMSRQLIKSLESNKEDCEENK